MGGENGINQRIPVALQNIFLASQRGDDVEKIKAPTRGIGFKIFRGRWGNRRRAKSVRAPIASTLHSDRSDSGRDTAADASRKAMRQKPKKKKAIDVESPQAFLDKESTLRGYSTTKYCSLEGGYYCRPSPLQQASYGTAVSQAVRASDGSRLRRLLDSGLSPNPCNNFGESLVHMVCRRADHKLLRILLEAGCSLQVTDDYGRTPLHDACWRNDPSFETVQLILESDKNLLNLLDCRGAAPLSYVKKENYGEWIKFLRIKLDQYWPKRDIATEGEERPPSLTLRQPHSLPIPDPPHALPLEVAAMVSNGRMAPEEAIFLDDESSDDESSYDSDSDSDSDDSYSSGSDESDFDTEEMAEICLRAGGPMAIAKKCFGNNVQVVGGQRMHKVH